MCKSLEAYYCLLSIGNIQNVQFEPFSGVIMTNPKLHTVTYRRKLRDKSPISFVVCLRKWKTCPSSTVSLSALQSSVTAEVKVIGRNTLAKSRILLRLVNNGICCLRSYCPVTAETQTRACLREVCMFESSFLYWVQLDTCRGSMWMIRFCDLKSPQGHAVIKDRLYLWNT